MFENKKAKNNLSCEDCMHYVICGHKDYIKKALEQVNTMEIEKGEFIKITAQCTEFKEIISMPRGGSSIR